MLHGYAQAITEASFYDKIQTRKLKTFAIS